MNVGDPYGSPHREVRSAYDHKVNLPPSRRPSVIPKKATGWVGTRPVGRMGWVDGSLVDLAPSQRGHAERILHAFSQVSGWWMNANGRFFHDVPLCSEYEPEGTVVEEWGLFVARFRKVGVRGSKSLGGRGVEFGVWVDDETGSEVPPQRLADSWARGDLSVVSRPAQIGWVW